MFAKSRVEIIKMPCIIPDAIVNELKFESGSLTVTLESRIVRAPNCPGFVEFAELVNLPDESGYETP